MIKGSAVGADERASIRNILRGTDSMTPHSPSRRRTQALVGWLLYCFIAAGGTAAAWTVRETLFPALGSPTPRSLLQDSGIETTASKESVSASTETPDDSVIASTGVAAALTTRESSIEGQTAASDSLPGGGPDNTVDNHGPDRGKEPETGTTVAETSSGSTPSGGPVTTIDAHTTITSGSSPTSSVDPSSTSTSTSTTDSVTTTTSDSDESGKGGDGKGGGKGGGGTTP